MKVLDSFTLYYDLSETDKLINDEKGLRSRGWNTEVNDYLFNDELKGYYMLIFTEIDGFVPEDLVECIKKYAFGDRKC